MYMQYGYHDYNCLKAVLQLNSVICYMCYSKIPNAIEQEKTASLVPGEALLQPEMQ